MTPPDGARDTRLEAASLPARDVRIQFRPDPETFAALQAFASAQGIKPNLAAKLIVKEAVHSSALLTALETLTGRVLVLEELIRLALSAADIASLDAAEEAGRARALAILEERYR